MPDSPHPIRVVVVTMVAVLLLACGEGGVSDPGEEPGVVVEITPGGAEVMVGETVALSASVTDDEGNPVSQAVSWSTSEPSVVEVDGGGTVSAVGAGSATVTAAAGSAADSVTIDVPAPTGTVGAGGGTVASTSLPVTLTVPSGVLTGPTAITIREATPDSLPAGGPSPIPGLAFDLAPDGLTFGTPATLALGFEPGALPPGTDARLLAVHLLDPTGWVEIRESRVDGSATEVSAPISGFSIYALAEGENDPPTAEITAPVQGETFAGGAAVTFEGTGTDPEDGVLDDAFSVTWLSDLDGELGTGSPLTTSTLSPGSHLVTLEVEDAHGLTAQDTVRIEVEASSGSLSVWLRTPETPTGPAYMAVAASTLDRTSASDPPTVEDVSPDAGLPVVGTYACRDGLQLAAGQSGTFTAQASSHGEASASASTTVTVTPDSVTYGFLLEVEAGAPPVSETEPTHNADTFARVGDQYQESVILALDGTEGRRYDVEIRWSIDGSATTFGSGTHGVWSARLERFPGCPRDPGYPDRSVFSQSTLGEPGQLQGSLTLTELLPGDHTMMLYVTAGADAYSTYGDATDDYSGQAAVQGTVTFRVLGESAQQ